MGNYLIIKVEKYSLLSGYISRNTTVKGDREDRKAHMRCQPEPILVRFDPSP